MSRRILSKELSPSAETLLKEMETSFQKEIIFEPIENIAHSSYGAVDCFSSKTYHVWLRTNLPQSAFEANLFHELRHIAQIEAGFPYVFNKDTVDFKSSGKDGKEFIERTGASVQSTVLDLDVISWLESHSISWEFFDKARHEHMLEQSNNEYPLLCDKLNFANVVIYYILHFCRSDAAEIDKVCAANPKYPQALSMAKDISSVILSTGFTTPVKAALCMCAILSKLEMWSHFYVICGSTKIRTERDYANFIMQQT